MYGFLGSKDELQQIMPPVINLINGRNDVPFPPDVGVGKIKGTYFSGLELFSEALLSITRQESEDA